MVATLAALALGGVAHGQRPQGGPGSGASLTIDFTAAAADGTPVTDLTPADVTVRVGGKVRTIESLTLKTIAAGKPAAAGIAPPFSTNEPVEGRSILIIVDVESLRAGTEVEIRTAIESVLKDVTAADRVGFSVAPRDTAQVALGSPLARVREAVEALRGSRPASVSNADALCRTKDTLEFVRAMMEPLAGQDQPTSLVFIAASLSTPGRASGSSGTCEVLTDHYQAIVTTAAGSRVNFYVVQGDPGTMGRQDGLENLAGESGAGQVMRVVGDGFAPRVLSEASNYWVATLAPDSSDRPGQPQRLEVRGVREGVTVRARTEVVIGRGAAGAKPESMSVGDMARSTQAFTDLQLRATAVSQRGQADKMTVLVFAQPVDPTVKIKEMSVGYFDQNNKGARISAKPEQIAAALVPIPLALDAGKYRIRVAAVDTNGKSGAVDINIDTSTTPAGSLKLSGLMLGASKGGSMSPQLIYKDEDKILAFIEFYGQIPAGTGIKAGFELSDSDTGKAISFVQAGGKSTNEPDKFQLFGELPIDKLAPGDYVVRAIVQLEGQPEGRVLRTFRKVAK